MRQLILTTLMTLCIFSCHAQITPVNDMEEVLSYFTTADSKTLAIFDVDMVLVQPSEPAFQMANMKRHGSISKRIMKDLPAEKLMLFLSLMTINSDPVLIDKNTPKLLQKLVDKGIPAMALTANLTGSCGAIKNMEEWRIQNLQQLGIDFTKTAPSQESLVFDNLASYRGNFSTYHKGIFFVNGTVVSKGEAFLAFLEKTGFSPDKIIFIDDREDNLKSMEAAIQKLEKPIAYQGLHFLGAKSYPSKLITEEEFESKWQKLAEQTKQID
jgi:hypothetical protein